MTGRIAARRGPTPKATPPGCWGWSEAAGRVAVYERAGGRCELGCGQLGGSWGHRRRRSQGGTWSPVNGLLLCGDGTRGCHGWLTAHPAEAAAGGWEVPSWLDPEAVPVWLAKPWPGWWLLTVEQPATGPRSHLAVPADPDIHGLPDRPALPPRRSLQ